MNEKNDTAAAVLRAADDLYLRHNPPGNDTCECPTCVAHRPWRAAGRPGVGEERPVTHGVMGMEAKLNGWIPPDKELRQPPAPVQVENDEGDLVPRCPQCKTAAAVLGATPNMTPQSWRCQCERCKKEFDVDASGQPVPRVRCVEGHVLKYKYLCPEIRLDEPLPGDMNGTRVIVLVPEKP